MFYKNCVVYPIGTKNLNFTGVYELGSSGIA